MKKYKCFGAVYGANIGTSDRPPSKPSSVHVPGAIASTAARKASGVAGTGSVVATADGGREAAAGASARPAAEGARSLAWTRASPAVGASANGKGTATPTSSSACASADNVKARTSGRWARSGRGRDINGSKNGAENRRKKQQ